MADEPRPSVEVIAAAQTASYLANAEAARAEDAKKGKITKKGKKATKEEKALALRAAITMDEHYIPLDELLGRYNVTVDQGLSKSQVKQRQAEEGFNRLTPPKEKPEWLKLLETQKGFFNLLLWGGAILCFIGYGLQKSVDNLYLGIVLSVVVTITGVFEYLQERNASDLMAQFKGLLPPAAQVLRGGSWDSLPSQELCRGDIVKITAGNKIPADIRVIQCSDDMKVEQAALTGEPDHLKRQPQYTHKENPLETANLLFFGTLCPSGNCTGVVVNIGDNTVMGRISAITTQTEDEISPIKVEINRFVKLVSGVAIFLGITFFIVGAVLGTDPITNLVFMIGIIVANVPEGLLATVTVCLSLTAQKMYFKNVLVKQLESVETLGSTTCICSDKTGTLTINKMTVANICVDQKIFETPDGRTVSQAYPLMDTSDDSTRRITRCACVSNNAFFTDSSKTAQQDDPELGLSKGDSIPYRKEITLGDGQIENRIMWNTSGDASESAMIKFAQEQPLFDAACYDAAREAGNQSVPAGKDGTALFSEKSAPGIMAARAAYPKVEVASGGTTKAWEIKFNSKNKYQVTVHSQPKDAEGNANPNPLLLMKGAPERILSRCSHVWQDGECIELTDEIRQSYENLNGELAAMGRRVLAFCEKELDAEAYPLDFDFSNSPVNYPIGENTQQLEAAAAAAEADPNAAKVDLRAGEKLVYLGLLALIDPPRPQVAPAVEKCKSAGIKVVMVTGDHPKTARAIAKEVGIIWGRTEEDIRKENMVAHGKEVLHPDEEGYTESNDPDFAPAIVVPGWTFDHLTDQDTWDDFLRHGQIVFARTSPQQKLIIVENFQKRGQVVAVTGDGVNDAPALKKADIGVAMGIMGSEVSKEAANMILLDDNFASIVAGVEEGRLIFDNLKKSIAYTLSSNIPEISPFLAFITVQVPLPLSTILILCVDLGTDMVPAISMAWENHEADIMSRMPRDKNKDHLVTLKLVCFAYLQIGVIQAAAGFFAWMTVLNDYGYPAHVLPSLGALDNWGKQILYCKVKGGALRAENGTAWPMAYDSMNSVQRLTAMGEGFYYWDWDVVKADKLEAMDSFKTGEVEACHFAAKAFGGSADQPSTGDSSWNKVFTSPSTYPDAADWAAQVDYSAGTVTTAQSMLAMHEAGYIEYIPFKSRMSPFYSRDWVEWNVMDQGTGLGIFGMGEGTLNSVHYTVQPFGYYTVGNSTMFSHDGGVAATAGTSKIIDDLPASYQIAGQTSDSMDKKFTSAYWLLPGRGEALKKFTHWKQHDSGKYYEQLDDISHLSAAEAQGSVLVNKLYSWAVTEAQSGMRQNVLSRQMQREALAHAQCAGFICIIVVQWADLMICKTRWLSIAQQGMVNPVMNFGLLFETILGCFLCYVPGLGDVLGTRPLRWTHWFPGLPFCLFIFFYDETRKKLMRATSTKMRDKDTKRMLNYPGWLERMTYY